MKKKYLEELLKPTPSGNEKLLSAWEGLSIETQIFIISSFEKDDEGLFDWHNYPNYLLRKIRLKALDSANDYVRYKAARKLYCTYDCSEKDIKINQKIENDSSDLVKYSQYELSSIESNNPKEFFSLPQGIRLAKFRSPSLFDDYPSLISQAVNQGIFNTKSKELELYELLKEYVNNPTFKDDFSQELEYDGSSEYYKGKRLTAWWGLVPKLPDIAANVLIEKLPEKTAMSDGLEGLVDNFSNKQLNTLLWREDIQLSDFRKKLFWQDKIETDSYAIYDKELWAQSCSSNFFLDDDDFSKLLSLEIDEKVERLQILGSYAKDMPLQYLLAIVLILDEVEGVSEHIVTDLYEKEIIQNNIKKRLKVVLSEGDDYELADFRLVFLASSVQSWESKDFTEKWFISLEDVDFNSFWNTYLNLSKRWNLNLATVSEMVKDLPKVYEYENDTSTEAHEENKHVLNDLELNMTTQKDIENIYKSVEKLKFGLYAILVLVFIALFKT